MGNHALVVGCDAYPQVLGGDLRGAVADALAMRDWVLRAAGVAPCDLTLLASPSAQGAQLPAGIEAEEANRRVLAKAVAVLVANEDVGSGDRLFVYFAGHGCRTDPLNETLSKDVIALHDFSPDDPAGGSAAVAELITRLEQSRFGDVILVLDACRNLPFSESFQTAALGKDPRAPANRPYTPRVFLAQATTPGGRAGGGPGGVGPRGPASGGGTAGDQIRGYFTTAILDGLAGEGSAKTFDEASSRPYQVTWSSLRAYLEARLAHQSPRLRGDGDPQLASFPDGWFPEVSLDIDVVPEAEGQPDLTVDVSYSDPTAFEDGRRRLPGPTPVQAVVPPRRLRVRAWRGPLRGQVWKDVYRDMSVTVPLSDGPLTSPLPTGLPVVRGAASTGGGIEVDTGGDPAAVVEVLDRSGAVLLSGVGTASGVLPPGDYTATVSGLGGRVISEPVGVEKGRLTHLSLSSPTADAPPLWPWLDPPTQPPSRLSRAGQLAALPMLLKAGRGGPVLVVMADASVSERVSLRREGGGDLPALVVGSPYEATLGEWELRDEASWATLGVGQHHLTVPVLAQTTTVLVLGSREAELALFDRTSKGPELLLLDRVQSLLAAQRTKAAAIAFDALAERVGDEVSARPLLHMLGQALPASGEDAGLGRDDPTAPLARAAPVAVRSHLLSGTMWAAVLDLPGAESILSQWRPAGARTVGEATT